jgi:hypothetical protein
MSGRAAVRYAASLEAEAIVSKLTPPGESTLPAAAGAVRSGADGCARR